MKLKYLLLTLFLVAGYPVKLHPINMTVTDLTLDGKKLKIKIKFFADDFQSSLSQSIKKPVDFINQPLSKSESNIRKYIESRFAMSLNGIPTKINYKKMWLASEVMFVEYETLLKDSKKLVSFKIKDRLLFDDFPEQKNIVNINMLGNLKILTFENGSEEIEKEVKF